MKENLKVVCLVIIAISTFTIALLDVLRLIADNSDYDNSASYAHVKATPVVKPVPGAKTTIKLRETGFDFGVIMQGDKVFHNFRIVNTGTNPLVIVEAHGSCGCTIPSYPSHPVDPGDSTLMSVEFNSTGKAGLQNKTVSITANTEPQVSELKITADVATPK